MIAVDVCCYKPSRIDHCIWLHITAVHVFPRTYTFHTSESQKEHFNITSGFIGIVSNIGGFKQACTFLLSLCRYRLIFLCGIRKKIKKYSHGLKQDCRFMCRNKSLRVSDKGTKPRKLIDRPGFRTKGSSLSVEHRGNFPFGH